MICHAMLWRDTLCYAMTYSDTVHRYDMYNNITFLNPLRGSSVNIGAIQRRLAWPLRKDDAHKSRSANKCNNNV